VNLSNSGYTVPAKLYDYLLAGRPILAVTDVNSPVERILAQSGVPYTCVYHRDSPEEIDRKLISFFRLPTDPVAPNVWFEEHFNGDRQVAALSALLDGLR
jgi:hypothetical protein